MTQDKILEIGALNIRIHPHPSPEIYRELFIDAFSLKFQFPLRGEVFAIMGSLFPGELGNPDSWVRGEIVRFIKINLDEPWFNLATFDEADDEECKKIIIPEHLRPNYYKIEFIMTPRSHTIFFEVYHERTKLSPGLAKKFFSRLFSHTKIIGKYGEIEVDVIPEREVVEQILNSPNLTDLHLIIRRPNPDDLADAERKLLEDLNSQNSREIRINHKAQKKKSLKPNETTKELGRIAAKNGVLSANTRLPDGTTKPISTTDHPETRKAKYNPKIEEYSQVMKRIILTMLSIGKKPKESQ